MRLPIKKLDRYGANAQYLLIFALSFLLAASFFLPYIIIDKGTFIFYGDYSVQQIPFYMNAVRALSEGNIFWDWYTDLGANFMGSYTYYMLGSPFFWLVAYLPFRCMPYALPWLLCLKIALAAVTSFAFIKRFTENAEYAFLAAVSYAFSSFSIYNIFFNQFHEAIAFFPLALIGIEELIEKGNKGIFAFSIFLNAIVNYYLFIGECFFLVIYFLVRLIKRSFKGITLLKFINLIFEGVLGMGMAGVYLLISYLSVSQVPRAFYKLSGYNALFYNKVQNYGNILHSFFFPAEMPAFPNFYNGIDAKWSSIAAWLPLFGMVAVIAYMQKRRKDWISILLPLLMFMSAVPALNSVFQLFSSSFYTRWFYMLLVIMALATAKGLETLSDRALKRGFWWTVWISAGIALPVILLTDKEKINNDSLAWYDKIGLVRFIDRYAVSVIVVALCLIVLYFLLFKIGRKDKSFFKISLLCLCVVICICGNYFISTGRIYKTAPKDSQTFIDRNIYGSIDLPDIDIVRTDVLSGIDNQTMFWGIPGVQAFHTVVPGSVTEFYTSLGVTRDVGSRPDKSHLWLRSLISCRYLLDAKNSEDIEMHGFKKIGQQNGFTVWENENYIPFGFTYDYYVDEDTFESVSKDEREKLLLRGIYLSDEQIEKYSYCLSPLPEEDKGYKTAYQMEDYVSSRKEDTVRGFYRDNKGFGGNITLEKDTLVFFSVPYEEGWSVTVNGKEQTVEKVNSGLMAVLCQKGDNIIRFDYFTPGLKWGIIISLISALAFVAYTVIFYLIRRKKNA